MPLKSKAQQGWMFANHPEMARRWAHHTPNVKALPEHVKKAPEKQEPEENAKKAFVASFLLKCAAAGITAPADVALAAEKFADSVTTTKQAFPGGELLGQGLGTVGGWALAAPVLGSVALPTIAGFGAGTLAAKGQNQIDTDDAKVLGMAAEANAYRRRTALAKTHAQVRKLLASDPSKYVLLGNQG